MLSKLIVHGQTREAAIARMRRALAEYRVEGIMTTIPFFTFIMNNPDFIAGQFDTGFIDRILPEIDFAERPADPRQLDAAVAAAAILAFEESQNVKLPEDVSSRWREIARKEALR
jgi:acetyl/propionyl-CoA carboxylase alpha subunit